MEWSDEYVWAYVEGELSSEERRFVEAELLSNPSLSAEIQLMREAMALLRGARGVPFEWYQPQWSRAAAADERGAWFRAQLKEGSADIDVKVDRDSEGAPVLSISWTATFLPYEGWTLALKPDSDQVARTFTLPAAKSGKWTAGPRELGFDPQDVPFEIAWTTRAF